MSNVSEIAKSCVDQALAATNESSLSEDALARALIAEAISIFRKTRSVNDIASELEFMAENLGDDEEYTFMRP